MLNLAQLETALSCSYPKEISQTTQMRRLSNIESLKRCLDDAKSDNELKYGITEERLCLYTTSRGERIVIQYPGQESESSEEEAVRPYDFRPRIILPDGVIIRDLTFADMWSVLENVDKDYSKLTKSLSALFFRMGRMIDYSYVTKKYSYQVIDTQNEKELSSGSRELSWFELDLDNAVIAALNRDIYSVPIDDLTISFEAFLYFFSLILANEDIKYNYKKKNLSSGRIPTSDSMLLLAAYFSEAISLSTLLQKYVSGFGVGKCGATEIGPATSGLIKIIDRKAEIIDLLNDYGVPYRLNSSITVSGVSTSVAIKIPSYKIAILNKPNSSREAMLNSREWLVFDIETTVISDTSYSRLLSFLGITDER